MGNLLENEKISLSEAFPEIENLVVTVQQGKYGNFDEPGIRFDEKNFRDFIFCETTLCQNGGLNLSDELSLTLKYMLQDSENSKESYASCKGMTRKRSRHDAGTDCSNSFKVTVSFTNLSHSQQLDK